MSRKQLNSLGLPKAAAETRVVVAMSGGVDSSVTAALLKSEGYDVVGITLQLYDHGAALGRSRACCAGQDIHDARRVAETAGFPHYVLDYESRFRRSVMEDFADSYLRGETPIPCVRCNMEVKFKDLLATARELGADALATGHYVRREDGPEGPELHVAKDASRDQSYFLFATTRAQLDYLRFPLGARPKDEVRRKAAAFGLSVADKPDSQDICFVPEGSYAQVVEKLRPGALEPGDIVHLDGRPLGRHDGIINFTIGQRRGLGIGGEREPLYVVRLEPDHHRVVVGPQGALACDVVGLTSVNWLGEQALDPQGEAVEVKLRSTMAKVPARLWRTADGGAQTRLECAQYGVSPGQAAVFYRGTRVLGGGWIESAVLEEAA
jgi:tRNA-specific 2-thiouridylase